MIDSQTLNGMLAESGMTKYKIAQEYGRRRGNPNALNYSTTMTRLFEHPETRSFQLVAEVVEIMGFSLRIEKR